MNALVLAVLFANLPQPASLTLDFDSTVAVTGREVTAAFAFGELNDIVAKSAGRGFELGRGGKPAHRIFIGRSAEAEKILGTSFWEGLGKEESRVFAKGEDLFLVGEGDLGPLWAVYDFCEDNLGYRCFAPRADGERVDKVEKIVYRGLSTARRPAFDGYRWPSWKNLFSHRWNARLNVRNRSPNGLEVFVKAKVKGSLEASGHVAWHGYDLYLPAYGTRRKLPDGIVTNNFVTHPEWFSLNEKGERSPDWQLCLSNRGCRDALTQAFFAWVRKYGRGNYMIASNDARHGHYCLCADCLALERKYGTMAGPLLDYLIELCGVLKEKGRDDVLVKTLAYCQETQQAPNLEKLPDNLLIDLAYVNMDRTPSELGFYAKGGFGRYSYLENAQKWGSLVSHYACWYYGGGAVVPPVFRMHKELNELYDAGVRCVYACGHDGGIEFNDLDDYFLLRLLMDPRQDPRRLLAETFEFEFGAAGPMLVEYAGMLERARRRAIAGNVSETSVPCICTYRQYDGGGIYTAEEVDFAQGIFERALAAVRDDPARTVRVRKARILMDMTTILHHPRLLRERPGFVWCQKEAETRMAALLPEIGKWDSWCEDNLRKIMAETYNFSNLRDEAVPAPLDRYPKAKVHRFLPPKSAFLAPPHKQDKDKRLTSYPDALSVCGWAMADDIPDRHARDPKARHISVGVYLHDKASYSLHGCLQTESVKGDRYALLCIGKAKLAPWTQMMFVYPKMAGLANAQLSRLYDPTYEQREYELWLSVRGEGPYFNGSGDARKNRLLMDQFFAVQMDEETEPISAELGRRK